MSTASAIYEGVVAHRRSEPREHAFSYRVLMMYLDLGELPQLFDGNLLWSSRWPALGWFRRSDYLGDAGVPLDQAVRELVVERTGYRPEGPVRVLTNVRCFGHCFNPVSFYYCFDPAGEEVEAVIAEVTNTPWGERQRYVLPAAAAVAAVALLGGGAFLVDYNSSHSGPSPASPAQVSTGSTGSAKALTVAPPRSSSRAPSSPASHPTPVGLVPVVAPSSPPATLAPTRKASTTPSPKKTASASPSPTKKASPSPSPSSSGPTTLSALVQLFSLRALDRD